MVDCAEIRAAYQDLYVELRKYIWDLDAVECLANLEASLYDAFIAKDVALAFLDKLAMYVRFSALEKDETDEIQEKIDVVRDLLEEDPQYISLYKVNETVQEDDLDEN